MHLVHIAMWVQNAVKDSGIEVGRLATAKRGMPLSIFGHPEIKAYSFEVYLLLNASNVVIYIGPSSCWIIGGTDRVTFEYSNPEFPDNLVEYLRPELNAKEDKLYHGWHIALGWLGNF